MRRFAVGIAACVGIAGLVAARAAAPPTAAEPPLPPAARAALVVRPALVPAQPAAAHALGLNWLQRSFRSHAALGQRAERLTTMVLEVGAGVETVGLARGEKDVAKVFESLRETPAGSIGTHDIYRVQRSPDYMALLGQEIVEGSAPALRCVLDAPPSDARHRALEQELRAATAPPAAATLTYLAGAEDASLARILRDLDCIWRGLARVVAPYETPLQLLGAMRGSRADVWQDADSVRVRVVFVAPGAMEAKRSLVALRTARQLAPLASDAAVRGGSLSQLDADLVLRVLQSMRTRAEDDKIHVDLAVDAAIVLPRR